MEKKDIIEYFDSCAASWDDEMIKDQSIVDTILDNGKVGSGKRVLDVACGTGVLIPDYLKRGVASVTGVDISSEMINRAKAKFTQNNVSFICGDVMDMDHSDSYDCIVVYNAFPHFPQPERTIEQLAAMLATGGVLTVAHGMSRASIDHHHSGSAHSVSIGLMGEDELAEIFSKYLSVTVKISDQHMYQVAGVKKA